jgi:hypothetical protein
MPDCPGTKWYFYYCDELDIYCFYEDSAKTEPQPSIVVYVPDLDREVKLELHGRGNKPYQDILDREYQDRLFPVDLYHEPYQLLPLSSQNMPDWKLVKWHRVIRVASMDPNQALCDLLVALRDKDRDAAMDWCEGLCDWLLDERVFPDLDDRRVRATVSKLFAGKEKRGK